MLAQQIKRNGGPPVNAIMEQQYPLFREYQALRAQLLEILGDEDLEFSLLGNPSLGELCCNIGEVQMAYIASFQTFGMDFSAQHAPAGVAKSISSLQSWYARLDAELEEAVQGLSAEQLTQKIDRGPDFQITPSTQLEIYKEALLIFYGKASIYMNAMGRLPGEQWQYWIA